MKTLHTSVAPILVAFFLCIFSQAQAQNWGFGNGVKGSGVIKTEARSVNSFDEITASTGIQVTYIQGSKRVEVTSDDNILEFIETIVKGNELIIRMKDNSNIKKSTKLEVHVSSPNLYAVSTTSGADFTANGKVKSTNMRLSASSGSELEIDVDAEKLKISCSSGADIEANVNADMVSVSSSSGSEVELSGKARSTEMTASSSGSIEAFEFTVDNCDASTSSAGDIQITVNSSINATASSGGNVTYKGSPKDINRNTSSGGKVKAD